MNELGSFYYISNGSLIIKSDSCVNKTALVLEKKSKLNNFTQLSDKSYFNVCKYALSNNVYKETIPL